jgi:hypothetical protein
MDLERTSPNANMPEVEVAKGNECTVPSAWTPVWINPLESRAKHPFSHFVLGFAPIMRKTFSDCDIPTLTCWHILHSLRIGPVVINEVARDWK